MNKPTEQGKALEKIEQSIEAYNKKYGAKYGLKDYNTGPQDYQEMNCLFETHGNYQRTPKP